MHQKYARIERERRFLLSRFPSDVSVTRIRHIHDRYLESTTLRLRRLVDKGGSPVFKLTQKIPERGEGGQQGFLTSMYLTEGEYALLSQLPARTLEKTRHSVPPFGIDIFEGELHGLLLAEAEFDSAAEADRLELPSFLSIEVSRDERFTGGRLARASHTDLVGWLAEYGITIFGRKNPESGR